MQTLKPIDTVYNGYRFRSRLEARWARFFDVLGVRWEYEKEGYNLGGAFYLPDFWLPDHHYWYEIKGAEPTEYEHDLAGRLREAHSPVCLHMGLPGQYKGWGYMMDMTDSSGGNSETNVDWFICRKCDRADLDFSEKNSRTICNAQWEPVGWCQCGIDHRDYQHPRLLRAILAARQARFEHGAQGGR